MKDRERIYSEYKIYIEEEETDEEVRKPYIPRYEEKKTERFETHNLQKISIPILQKMIRDMQNDEPEQLPAIGSKVVGNLFDRVRFLRERITEVKKAIIEREAMNAKFNKEIEKDIEELEKVLPTISNREELREFKLNITLLRMEKRKENTIFWRDILNLKKQLKELTEEYEIETKLSSLFSNLNPG